MEKALATSMTYSKDRCERKAEGGEISEYERCSVVLPPELCKRDFRDPLPGWNLNQVGCKGMWK